MADSSVRLAGRLPDGDKNGLAAIAHLLVDDPSGVHVAIVLLDCSRLVTSVDDGAVLPTARVRAIEPIAEGPDAHELRRLLRRAVEKRTGQTELPLELERALEELGVGVDVLADEEPAPRVPDARERAAGDDRDDEPLPAPDAEHLDSEGRAPGHPEYCAEGCIHVDPDAPAADDELAADDPRRGPLPGGGLFREPNEDSDPS